MCNFFLKIYIFQHHIVYNSSLKQRMHESHRERILCVSLKRFKKGDAVTTHTHTVCMSVCYEYMVKVMMMLFKK